MPIDRTTPSSTPTGSSAASHVVEDVRSSNVEPLSPSTPPPPIGELLGNLPGRSSTEGGSTGFAAAIVEPSLVTPAEMSRAQERALELLRKGKVTQSGIADTLVLSLSCPLETIRDCQLLDLELMRLAEMSDAEAKDGIDQETYRQLTNAIMRASRRQTNVSQDAWAQRADGLTIHHAQQTVEDAMSNGAAGDEAVAAAMTRHSLTHPSDLNHLRRRANAIEATRRDPRVDPIRLENAQWTLTRYMRDGASVEHAVAGAVSRHLLTNADDLNDLRQFAAALAPNDRQRLAREDTLLQARRSVRKAIDEGASADEAVSIAIERHALTHPVDTNDLRLQAAKH